MNSHVIIDFDVDPIIENNNNATILVVDSFVTPHQSVDIAIIEKVNPLGIEEPWTLSYFLSIRGSEYFHMYLWIAKDFCWSQNFYYPALVFGSAALAWVLVLASHAYHNECYVELYMVVVVALWLSGNYVWMYEEVTYQTDDLFKPKAEIILLV